jgi:hypothetical protein
MKNEYEKATNRPYETRKDGEKVKSDEQKPKK